MRERVVWLVLEHRSEYATQAACLTAIARQENVGKESLRRWVIQHEIDHGKRDGTTTEETAEIKRLKAEKKAASLILWLFLKAATTFFAGELDSRNS